MSETKHTPVPWHLDIGYDDEKCETGTSISITEINRLLHDFKWADCEEWELDLANAQFIVQAVNCHDELLKACKAARDGFLLLADQHDDNWMGYVAYIDKLNAVIAKAEGR
jgi:hypothetical protein